MELNAPIAHLEVLEVTADSVHIRLMTLDGEEYQVHLAQGDALEAHIPETLSSDTYALLERYLSRPLPPDLLQASAPEDSSASAEPAVRSNRVLEELQNLEPPLRHPLCPQCGKPEQLAITHEGIVIVCRACDQARRVDAAILQRLADALGVLCFSCAAGKLKSESAEYANLLVCQNPACGSNNSWRGVSDRLQS